MLMVYAPKLLCTDLDRTLLPNGPQEESPYARPILKKLLRALDVQLAFVSGRRLQLHLEAIEEYDLPEPNHIIADVGASIYEKVDGNWVANRGWHDQLAAAWQGKEWQDLLPLLEDIAELAPQEEASQCAHKLSFNVAKLEARETVVREVRKRLDAAGLKADLIWSVDETVPMGLLDVMAEGATKLGAVTWLAQSEELATESVLCAGDSGNDLPVLTSPFPSVLVANATAEVRDEACHLSALASSAESLHLAQGGLFGMNGCYSAGILEGFRHFYPRAARFLAGEKEF